jgi:isoleucyl-tRNA synthetase
MGVVKQVVGCGHALREQASQRVRQPLAEIRVAAPELQYRAALERLGALVTEELNTKRLTLVESLGDLTAVTAKPNFGVLGPRYGKDVQKIAAALSQAPAPLIRSLHAGQTVAIEADGRSFELAPADVSIQVSTQPGWVVDQCGAVQVALDTRITPELRREGLARDVVRHIQQLRKDIGLNIEDRIEVAYRTDDAHLAQAIEGWKSYLMAETLCDSLVSVTLGLEPKMIKIGNAILWLELRSK